MQSKVFKGLTRPPMMMGVPLSVFVSICLGWAILGSLLTIFYKFGFLAIFLAVPSIFIAKDVTRKDDYAFRLHFLKLITRGNPKGNKIFKANTFISEQYKKPKNNTKRESLKMKLNIFDIANYSKFIPYSSLVADEIVMTREGYYLATWEIQGIPFLTVDDNDLKVSSDVLDTLFRTFSESPIAFYRHSIRTDALDEIRSNFQDNFYLEKVNDLYFDGLKNQTFKRNIYYITIVYNPFESRYQKKSFPKLSIAEKQNFINYHIDEMKGFIVGISETIKSFNGKILSTFEKNNITYSKQLSFYNFLLTHEWKDIKVNSSPIYNRLGDVDLFFNKGIGEIASSDKKQFFKCIEIKDYENELEVGFLDALLCTKGDYILTQSFSIMGKKEAEKALKDQENKLRGTETNAKTELAEIEIAMDEVATGNLSFGQYHFVLMVYGDSIIDVNEKTKEIGNILGGLGLITVESSVALEASFWSQFPSNFQYRPRTPIISSKNYSHLGDFHNLTSGKAHNNSWGDAVTLLKTPSGQPYYFNYHISLGANKNDFGEKIVGHTLVLGATGTGKTALMNFLFNQSRKFSAEETFGQDAIKKKFLSIYFDKDKGAMGNILASGGVYLSVKSGEKTGFAPFKCENTPKNISFLIELIQLLVTRRGEQLTTFEEVEISHAVKAVMSLPFEMRGNCITKLLSNIQSGKTEAELKNSLALRLSLWARGGANGWVFDNDDDLLDFEKNDIFGIDGTDFLDDVNTCAPISRYLVHRVYLMLDGRRGQLKIDETWKYTENPIMAKAMEDLLVTSRKSDWMVVMGTQSPSQILRSSFAKAIIEQCETYLFLPNPKAEKADYMQLGLSEREFDIIKTLNPASRQFLVKKSNGATLCELNLSTLGKYLKLISTAKSDIQILETIATTGAEPHEWIPVYLDMNL